MSQAFVKEGDASDDLPERPVPDRPNYVTPAGLADLKRRKEELTRRRAELVRERAPETEAELKLVERDLRYFEIRSASATLVRREPGPAEEVLFGAAVEVEDSGERRRYLIVGEDEADAGAGKLSWCSPLAMSLLGLKVGDSAGSLKIVSISYP